MLQQVRLNCRLPLCLSPYKALISKHTLSAGRFSSGGGSTYTLSPRSALRYAVSKSIWSSRNLLLDANANTMRTVDMFTTGDDVPSTWKSYPGRCENPLRVAQSLALYRVATSSSVFVVSTHLHDTVLRPFGLSTTTQVPRFYVNPTRVAFNSSCLASSHLC